VAAQLQSIGHEGGVVKCPSALAVVVAYYDYGMYRVFCITDHDCKEGGYGGCRGEKGVPGREFSTGFPQVFHNFSTGFPQAGAGVSG
jgi:hypothetical protein